MTIRIAAGSKWQVMAVRAGAAGRGIVLSALAFLFVSACGGSNDPAPAAAPPPPPPSGIGTAGGTVTGPNGSSIVVPANALSQNTAIAIAVSSQGPPALPANTEPAGEIYAMTPHGTAFALPATVAVPFDGARVPAGRSVGLIKTNAAQSGWESVPGATVSGSTMTAQTSSLSWWLAILLPAAPTITTEPADATVDVGQPATFSVTAQPNGAAISSYKWRRNGADISCDAATPSCDTSSSYAIASATAADNGAIFDVVVTNSVGAVTSRAARLTVNVPSGWTTVGGQVNGALFARFPSVAVHSDGTIYVAYGEGSSGISGLLGSLRVKKLVPGSSTWADVGSGALNTGIGTAPQFPHIRVRSNGEPVVAWTNQHVPGCDVTLPDCIAFNEIVVQEWNGSSWQRLGGRPNPAGISGGARSANGVILALEPGTDQPHVAFLEGICNVFRSWNGVTWQPDELTIQSRERACATSAQSALAMAVSNAGIEYVAGSPVPPPPSADLRNWIAVRYRGPGDDGYFNSQLGGAPVNGTAVSDLFTAGLTFGPANAPVIAYAYRSPATSLMVREWTGVFWRALGGDLLTSDPLMDDTLVSPVRIESSLGVLGVVWATGTPQATRITGRVWNGTAWQRVPAPHDSVANVGHFAVTVGSDGTTYVALTERPAAGDDPSLGTDLFVRRCANWCL